MNDLATLRAYLMDKTGAQETYPFGPETLVIKVVNKMFALVDERAQPLTVSLKCDPAHAQFLRDEYSAVSAGYHLDKRHWITATLDGSIPDAEVRGMIDESYALVVQGLTRAQRQQLATPPSE